MRYGRLWLSWVTCWVLASAQHDIESEHTRKVLGSSVVTSVSVIMDHGNGTRTYIADAAGHPLTQHEGPVGSPADLLSPDRYEFYTFDESGDLIKKLMTLDQIHGLIAGGDVDALDSIDSSAPTYYHAGNQGHIDVSDLEPTDMQGVHNVVANVQNVLKGELEASKNKPLSTKPISMLSVPDAASSWSILLPGVLGGAEDAMSEAVLSEPESISKFTVQSSVRPSVTETTSPKDKPLSANKPTVKPSASVISASVSPTTQSTPTKTTHEKPHTVTTTTEKLLSNVKTVPSTEEFTTEAYTKKKVNLVTTTPAVPVTQRRTNSPTIIHYLTIQNVHATSIIPDRTTEKTSPTPLRTTLGSPTLSTSHIHKNISAEYNTTKYESTTPAVSYFHKKATSTLSPGSLSTSYVSVTPTSPEISERTTLSSSQIYEKTASGSSPGPLSTMYSKSPQINDRITNTVSPIHADNDSVTPISPQIYEKIPAISSSGSPVSTTYNSVTPSASQIFERIPSVTSSGSPISTTYNSVTSSASQIFERIPYVTSSGSPISTTYNSVTPSELQIFERIPSVTSSGSPISATFNSETSSESQLFERLPAISPSGSPISTTYNLVTPSESQIYERIPIVGSSVSPVSTPDTLVSPADERFTDINSSGSPLSTKYSSVTPSASLVYEIITNINSLEPLSTTYISKPQPITDNETGKNTPEPLRTTYSSISSPVSETHKIATDKYFERPLNTTTLLSATVPDVSERITEADYPELLRITLTDTAPSLNTYQPTTNTPLIYSESSSPLSAVFNQISPSKLDSPQSIPIIEGMAEALSDVLLQVTNKQNYTTDYMSATSPQSDKTNATVDEDISSDHETHVTTAKYTSASTDETFETQFTNQQLYTLIRNPPEESTAVTSTTSNDSVADNESASFYDKSSESTELQRVASEVMGAESDLPSTSKVNSFTETSFLTNGSEELHEVHLKTQQSEQVVKIVTPGTLASQSSLPEPNKTDVTITTYKPSTYRPITSSTREPTTAEPTMFTSETILSTLSEQLLSTLTTPKLNDYSTTSLINSVPEMESDTTNSPYKPDFTTENTEYVAVDNTTDVQLSSSEVYENSTAVIDNNDSYGFNDSKNENNTLKLVVHSSPSEYLDTENSLVKAGISAVTSILLDQQSPNEPQLPLPTDSLSQSSTFPESVDPVSGELKHASTFVTEYDTTAVTEAYTATEELTTALVEDNNKQESVESSYNFVPIKEAAVDSNAAYEAENVSEISDNTESVTVYGVDTMTTAATQNGPSTVKANTSQALPTKESKLSEDQSEQNVTKSDYIPDAFVDETVSEAAPKLGHNKDPLEFAQTVISNTAQNLNFANSKPATAPPKEEVSLTPENAKPTEFLEKIELKTAAPPGDSKVSFVKKPATMYRPVPSEVSLTPPTAVELHPAPHESMGLEATTAFLADDVRRFSDLCNELAFRMWTSITGKGSISSRSIVLSPFAVTSLLAMVFLGARGPTSGQMNDILRLDDMVTFNPHQVLQNITETVLNSKNFGVATAAFVRELYSDKSKGKILDFYKERAQQYYDGHVEEISFHVIGDILRRRTNLLVKRQTLGKVPEYLRGSGLHMRPPLAAFSANIFQTDCEQGSTDGRDGEMYFVVRPSTRQRRLVPVPAAVWRTGFLAGYEPGLDATAVSLGSDSVVSTILILPGQQGQVAPGDGLARLEQRLIETSYRRGGWTRLLRSLLPRPGLELQIPRYSHRSVLNVTGALQRMGLKDLFNAGRADLRGLNGLSNDLHLSDMVQVNTFSTCGEETVGARHHVETYPVSPQRMGREDPEMYPQPDEEEELPFSALPLALRPRQARLPDNPRLRFDRPFLYVVRHNPTGMILHMGRFNPRLLP